MIKKIINSILGGALYLLIGMLIVLIPTLIYAVLYSLFTGGNYPDPSFTKPFATIIIPIMVIIGLYDGFNEFNIISKIVG